jgi:hypothetical protein
MSSCNEKSSSHFFVGNTRRSAILVLVAVYILCNLVASFHSLKSFSSGIFQVHGDNDKSIVLSQRKNTIAEEEVARGVDDNGDQHSAAFTMMIVDDDDSTQQHHDSSVHIRQDPSMIPSTTSSSPLKLVVCATVR